MIDREAELTTLHVNSAKSTLEVPLRLIENYARAPWVNKEKGMIHLYCGASIVYKHHIVIEMIRPPRPVRRPEEFYQVFLGGVDDEYMTTALGGYTGCLRGLSVGGHILDLTSKGAEGIGRGKLLVYSCFSSFHRRLLFKT